MHGSISARRSVKTPEIPPKNQQYDATTLWLDAHFMIQATKSLVFRLEWRRSDRICEKNSDIVK